ncbi:MAG: pyruvate ferredoxin oxidoreductase [Pseudomonadota bacterium]
MSKRVGIEVSLAAAEAVAQANVDVVAAYPITPQTHVVEHLAELVAEGHLKAQYVAVESEHSAISACMGASAAGGRTFTSTASQGLALMHEILFIASSLRLPIVMLVANRAISAPINIWADHSDIMPERDTGWVQIFAENGQEVYDLTLMSFKLAEDPRVLLPTLVTMDGFTLSHVIEPVVMQDQADVERFLPACAIPVRLDPADPRTIGPFGDGTVYTEVKLAQEMALAQSATVFAEVAGQFAETFGNHYQAIETYRCEDAETIIVSMGSVGETARTAVDEMRASGQKVGQLSIRLWRPFPLAAFQAAAAHAKRLAILDRHLIPGGQGGPIGLEARAAFYQTGGPAISDFVAGLGGRGISRATFREMVARTDAGAAQANNYTFLDARLS